MCVCVCVCVCVCTRARLFVTFCCKLGKYFTEIFQLLNQVYREDCMSQMQGYEWFKHFREGRMSVGEDPRPGRPSTSTNNDHVERVRAVFHGNHCSTVWEVADEVVISIGSCHQILMKNFRCVLSVQNSCRVFDWQSEREPCWNQSGTVDNANGNENFLKNIITGDETWVYEYDVETKMQSSQWMGKGLLNQKKHRWVGQSWRCCWLCVLIGKALSIMNFYHVVRW